MWYTARMLIWGALLLPIFTILGLFIFAKGKLTFWEAAIIVVVPLIFIVIFKYSVTTYMVSDTEFWGGWIEKAVYEEHWNEYIHKTCSYETCSGTGKNRSCTTHYYDCSYVADYPEHWTVYSNLGESYGVSRVDFERLATKFGNRVWVNMHRNYHTINGNAYYATYQGIEPTIEPVVSKRSYVNKVAASSSIFNFPDIPLDQAIRENLFGYPELSGYNQKALLGFDDPQGEGKLENLNGIVGKWHQAKVFVLVWKNQPVEKAFRQQQYWKNGNKNELVINIGINDSAEIKWAYVFSWTDAQEIKQHTQSFVMEQKQLNVSQLADWLRAEIPKEWRRKHFKEFNYVTVDPPTWAVIVTYLVSFLLTCGIGFWSVTNEFDSTLVNSNTVRLSDGFDSGYGSGFNRSRPLGLGLNKNFRKRKGRY